jgi:hypothetical protein
MTDAQVAGIKSLSEAKQALADFKNAGYDNLCLIGPITSASMDNVANAEWVVVATDALIRVVPPNKTAINALLQS